MITDSAPPMRPAARAKVRYIVPISLWLVESSQRIGPCGRSCGRPTVAVEAIGQPRPAFGGRWLNRPFAPAVPCTIVACPWHAETGTALRHCELPLGPGWA